MELDLLRAFVAVAEAGSFTAAAEVLARTQSAVSQQVARLESALARRVFERTSRTMSLTPEGEVLLGYARRLIALSDEAVCRITATELQGVLRLGVCEDIIPRQLPRLLARFGAHHPGVSLQLFTDLSTGLKARLAAGGLDLAIAKRDGDNVQGGRVIWREPMVWFAAAQFQLTPDAELPLVLLPPPCSYRAMALEALQQAGRASRIACTCHSLMGLQAAVAGGLGVSILGRSFVQEGLRELPPGLLPELPQTEFAIFGEEGARVPAAAPLVAFLLEELNAGSCGPG
ncbi:LysR substrate-binding domain-containing protein [Megalodesulfovibrio paquesii]